MHFPTSAAKRRQNSDVPSRTVSSHWRWHLWASHIFWIEQRSRQIEFYIWSNSTGPPWQNDRAHREIQPKNRDLRWRETIHWVHVEMIADGFTWSSELTSLWRPLPCTAGSSIENGHRALTPTGILVIQVFIAGVCDLSCIGGMDCYHEVVDTLLRCWCLR